MGYLLKRRGRWRLYLLPASTWGSRMIGFCGLRGDWWDLHSPRGDRQVVPDGMSGRSFPSIVHLLLTQDVLNASWMLLLHSNSYSALHGPCFPPPIPGSVPNKSLSSQILWEGDLLESATIPLDLNIYIFVKVKTDNYLKKCLLSKSWQAKHIQPEHDNWSEWYLELSENTNQSFLQWGLTWTISCSWAVFHWVITGHCSFQVIRACP